MAARRVKSSPRRTASGSSVATDRYVQLFEALSPLIGSHCTDEVTEAACNVMARLLDVRACSIFLRTEPRGGLVLRAATHIPKSEWPNVLLPLNSGICARAIKAKKSILLRSAADFAKFGMKHNAAYGRASCVVSPLFVRGKPEGVVNVAHPKRARAFNQRDVVLIEAAGRLIAGGVQNALQFHETVLIHDHLEETLDNLHIGVLALNSDLEVTHSNLRFRELNGAPEHRVRGLPLRGALSDAVYNVSHRLIRDTLDRGPVCQEHLRAEMGGRERALEITASRVGCGGDAHSDCLLLFEDVSEKEEIERLREADSIKGAFLRMIQHELRTPLTVIQGAMPVLKSCADSTNGTSGAMLGRVEPLISANVLKLTGLINTILEVIEIESGTLKLLFREFDLNTLVGEKLDLVRQRAALKSIQLKANLDAKLPPVVADEQRLGQTLYELLDNAIKFSPEGGIVGIETRSSADGAAIRVSNQGDPIPPKNREKVFEKFYQVDQRTTRKTGGCGMGLYLARNIAEMHRGAIRILDGEHGETIFEVALPLAQKALARA